MLRWQVESARLMKTIHWFLSLTLKWLGGWKMLWMALIKAIAVAGWRRGRWKKLIKGFGNKR
jgi:hypothetical protein